MQKEIQKYQKEKDFQKIYSKLYQFYKKYSKNEIVNELDFPVRIETIPSEAEVRINDRKYRTPCLAYYRFQKGETFFKVFKWGYKTLTIPLQTGKFQELKIHLSKTPLTSFPPLKQEPLGPIINKCIPWGKKVYFLSRDGFFYNLSFERFGYSLETSLEKSIKVSTPGNLFTPFLVNRENYVFWGSPADIKAFNLKNMKLLDAFPSPRNFPQKFKMPLSFYFPPLFIENRYICIPNEDGYIYVLKFSSSKNFQFVSRYNLLEPVLGRLQLWNHRVYCVTPSGKLVSLLWKDETLKREWYILGETPFSHSPIIYGEYIFLSSQNDAFLYHRKKGKLLWKKRVSLFLKEPFLKYENGFLLA
ncbi:MAG: hypothetical protein D6785_13735, partial [Planctomycetota bacterium]